MLMLNAFCERGSIDTKDEVCEGGKLPRMNGVTVARTQKKAREQRMSC